MSEIYRYGSAVFVGLHAHLESEMGYFGSRNNEQQRVTVAT